MEDYFTGDVFGDELLMGSNTTMDPYPFYPILDGASDMCIGKGDGCEVCGVTKDHSNELGLFPTQLPLLDLSDIESQLGQVHDEDSMRCVNINQIFNMPMKPEHDSDSNHMDKVISDCMWSSSSPHRMGMDTVDSSPLPKLSVENDVEFSRPETPQTDSESVGTDSDDLIQRVPKEKSVKMVVTSQEKAQLCSGRSLLKRNQMLKVARAPYRSESKPSFSSQSTDSSYAGDHSYSAITCVGILTPSPSPSESSSGELRPRERSRKSFGEMNLAGRVVAVF